LRYAEQAARFEQEVKATPVGDERPAAVAAWGRSRNCVAMRGRERSEAVLRQRQTHGGLEVSVVVSSHQDAFPRSAQVNQQNGCGACRNDMVQTSQGVNYLYPHGKAVVDDGGWGLALLIVRQQKNRLDGSTVSLLEDLSANLQRRFGARVAPQPQLLQAQAVIRATSTELDDARIPSALLAGLSN